MSLGTLIRTVLSPSWDLRWGASERGGGVSYVLFGVHPVQGERVLLCGEDLARVPQWLRPLPVHAELGAVPLRFVSEPCEQAQADEWLDRNEERMRPAGLSAEQVVTESAVLEGAMYAATGRGDMLADVVRRLQERDCVLGSLTPPLWDLAALYARSIEGPFALWDMRAEGSVMAYVVDSRPRALVTWWPTPADLQGEQAGEVTAEAAKLLDSLCDRTTRRLVARGFVGLPEVPGYEVQAAPVTTGIPEALHAAYACALHESPSLDFAPFAGRQQARRLAGSRRVALRVGQALTAAAALLVCVVGLTAGGVSLTDYATRSRTGPLREQVAALSALQARVDSLSRSLARETALAARQSSVTGLLSDLQEALPEGTWLAEMAVAEASGEWQVEMTALAYSSGAVPELLRKLAAVPGVSGVRLVYSEQVRKGQVKGLTTNALRLRVACSYGGTLLSRRDSAQAHPLTPSPAGEGNANARMPGEVTPVSGTDAPLPALRGTEGPPWLG